MTKFILGLILLTISFSSFSQNMYENVETQIIDTKINSDRTKKHVASYYFEEGIVKIQGEAIRGPGGYNYFLRRYDWASDQTTFKEITTFIPGVTFKIRDFVKIEGRFVLFTTVDEGSKKTEHLFAQTLDWETGELGEPTLVLSQKYETTKSINSYQFEHSSDNNLVLIGISHKGAANLTNKDQYSFITINSELKIINDALKIDYGVKGKTSGIGSFKVDNNGSIFTISSIFTAKRDTPDQENYTYEHVLYSIINNEITQTSIEFENHFIFNPKLATSKDGSIYIGASSTEANYILCKGILLLKIDQKTGAINSKNQLDFDSNLSSQEWPYKQHLDKLNLESIKGLNFIEIITHKNGSKTAIYETEYYGGRSDLFIVNLNDNDLDNELTIIRLNEDEFKVRAHLILSIDNKISIIANRERRDYFEYDKNTVTKSERKQMRGFGLSLIEINELNKVNCFGLVDYKNPVFENYDQIKRVGNSISVYENGIFKTIRFALHSDDMKSNYVEIRRY